MTDRRLAEAPFDSAGHAAAEQGVVLLDGPDGIAIAMTPEAASQTGERLVAAAKEARQQIFSQITKPAPDLSGD